MLSFFSAFRDSQRYQHCILSKNMMADDKVFVDNDSTRTPEFIQELLPSAERTALLYHLSYLCLGSFPKPERLLRERALKTQLLFGSSGALLLKCVGTSENLVISLLPNLKVAVEKNKPQLAVKFLEKAEKWIYDIIKDVEEFVNRYNTHNSGVAASISDIITEIEENKTAQQQHQQQQTSVMEALQKINVGLKARLGKINKEIEDYEKKVEEKKREINQFISSRKEPTQQTYSENIFSNLLLNFYAIMENNYIHKIIQYTSDAYHLRTIHADLSEMIEAQKSLKDQEWKLQYELMDNELNLDKLKIEKDQVPIITHLEEVQKSLSQIQQILVQIQKFWEEVSSLLDTLKKRTSGEIWMEDLTDMKEEFLQSIDAAQEEWTNFGISCLKANKIFSFQTNQAYRFLEISPSSLSKEELEKEIERVKEKLQKISPLLPVHNVKNDLKLLQ